MVIRRRGRPQWLPCLFPPHPGRLIVSFVGIAAGTVAALGLGRICRLVRDFDRRVLVHLAHGGQLDAGVLHDVVRGSVRRPRYLDQPVPRRVGMSVPA